MQKNGYSDLTEGPEAGWLGYYSLDKQGRMAGASLGDLITAAGAEGLVWTDPQVQPQLNLQLQVPSSLLPRLTPQCAATMATSRPPVATPSPSVSTATERARLVKVQGWGLPLCLKGILNMFDLSNKKFQKNPT